MEKSKRNFKKSKFLLQTVPLQEILQQKKKNPFYHKMILYK